MSKEYYAIAGIQINQTEFDNDRTCEKCNQVCRRTEDVFCAKCGKVLEKSEVKLSLFDPEINSRLDNITGTYGLDHMMSDNYLYIGVIDVSDSKSQKDNGIPISEDLQEHIRKIEKLLGLTKEHYIELFLVKD